jgi:hypothetical protein
MSYRRKERKKEGRMEGGKENMVGVLGRWTYVNEEALLQHNPHKSGKFKGRRKKFLSVTSNTRSK